MVRFGLDIPPNCGGCGKKGFRWCPTCDNQTETLGSSICQVCGGRIIEGHICKNCLRKQPEYDALRSWGLFKGPLREALHKLKYRRDISLGEILSRYLIKFYADSGWKVDLIIPVPLSTSRLKQRGYNQAALLAKPIALFYGINYSKKALFRVKDTPSQVGLTIDQRRQNVAGAFLADPALVNGLIVLIIDDVTTTGATIESCAKALIQSGASRVIGLTLARA